MMEGTWAANVTRTSRPWADAVAGGVSVFGARVGRITGAIQGGDVRCSKNIASTMPAYWHVTFDFRGGGHRIQMSAFRGSTTMLNGNREPL